MLGVLWRSWEQPHRALRNKQLRQYTSFWLIQRREIDMGLTLFCGLRLYFPDQNGKIGIADLIITEDVLRIFENNGRGFLL